MTAAWAVTINGALSTLLSSGLPTSVLTVVMRNTTTSGALACICSKSCAVCAVVTAWVTVVLEIGWRMPVEVASAPRATDAIELISNANVTSKGVVRLNLHIMVRMKPTNPQCDAEIARHGWQPDHAGVPGGDAAAEQPDQRADYHDEHDVHVFAGGDGQLFGVGEPDHGVVEDGVE